MSCYTPCSPSSNRVTGWQIAQAITQNQWVGIILGIFFAIGGAILIGMFFDWVVIILSSLGGAVLIVGAFTLDGIVRILAFLGLFLLGIAIQASDLRKDKKK